MIVPGSQAFTGYVGSTFDQLITVYPSGDSIYNWQGNWTLGTNYSPANAVIGSDGNAYAALKANISINPVGDLSGSWTTPLPPMNLNGYSGIFNIMPSAADEFTTTPVLATPVVIQGTQGTIFIKFTPTQTGAMVPGTYHQYLQMTDPVGNIYFYVNGTFTWTSP